jgi:hypothetical protein
MGNVAAESNAHNLDGTGTDEGYRSKSFPLNRLSLSKVGFFIETATKGRGRG